MLSLVSDTWSCGIRKITGETYASTAEGFWRTLAERYFQSDGRVHPTNTSPWHSFYRADKNNFVNCWLMTHSVQRKAQIGDSIVQYLLGNKLGTVSISDPVPNPVHEDREIVVYTFHIDREAFSEFARQVHAKKAQPAAPAACQLDFPAAGKVALDNVWN